MSKVPGGTQSDENPQSLWAELIVGVQYGYQAYGGTLRPATVVVTGKALGVHIKVEGSGYSSAKEAKIYGWWLTLPHELAREVGEQLVRLSGGSPGRWRRDYPEEAERQRKERERELESFISQLRGEHRERQAEP